MLFIFIYGDKDWLVSFTSSFVQTFKMTRSTIAHAVIKYLSSWGALSLLDKCMVRVWERS